MANAATKRFKTAENNLYDILGMEEESHPGAWDGLPEFVQEDNEAEYVIQVRIRSDADLEEFAKLVGQPKLTHKTKKNVKSIWYPALEHGERGMSALYAWMDEDQIDIKND